MTSPNPQQDLMRKALLELRELRAKLEAKENEAHEPIAIIGMGCRFPGADSPEAFWELLRTGSETVAEVPRSRWDVERYYDSDRDAVGKIYTKRGGFLEDVSHFDAAFFGISPKEALSMDPKQRLLLELAWETLERANLSPDALFGRPVGVFVGIGGFDFPARLLAERGENLDAYFASGSSHCVAAGRISYQLGLTGPSMAVDTACSSSLVSVHLAVQSLRRGECELALAGGANLMLTPDVSINFCRAKMLAADGRCKAFDAAADGYVRGEGVGLVVLKRLRAALEDGDSIQAVIRGSAVNQDGASGGLTVPNGPAQTRVIQAALADARVTAEQISYLEAHGTGTSLGDPIEVGALAKIFGHLEHRLLIGTVKTNIGHLESAAGIAGLIKLALSLKHAAIPASLHFETPNPKIPWRALSLEVPTQLQQWDAPERYAGVSAFAFMGTNAHLILANAPKAVPKVAEVAAAQPERSHQLLAFSAKSETALRELAKRYALLAQAEAVPPLADFCFTANNCRAHHAWRAAIVAENHADLAQQLLAFAQEGPGSQLPGAKGSARIAFLFSGQGAQLPGMGRELFSEQPVFRAAMERCAQILQPLLPQPLLEVLYGQDPQITALIDQTAYTQPALFSVSFALAELWRSWGVQPVAVLGHSVGEFAAACVAGIFSLEDGLRLIAARARLMQRLPAGGGMLAVRAAPAQLQLRIADQADQLAIAAFNGPESTVLSGSLVHLQPLAERLQAEGFSCKLLRVSHAFHSPLMEPILSAFREEAAAIPYQEQRITFVSNLDGKPLAAAGMNAEYWVRQLREPVAFTQAMQSLDELQIDAFVELGPQPQLLALGKDCLAKSHAQAEEQAVEALWLPSLRAGSGERGSDWRPLLQSLAALYRAGVAVDWLAFDRAYLRRRVDLPTYPFDRQDFPLPKQPQTLETATDPADSVAKENSSINACLGSDAPLMSGFFAGTWREDEAADVFETTLTPENPPYLKDHRLFGTVLTPASYFVDLALAAAKRFHPASFVSELHVEKPLVLHADGARLKLVMDRSVNGRRGFKLLVSRDLEQEIHAQGTIQLESDENLKQAEALDVLRTRISEERNPADQLQSFQELGLDYGPSFRGIRSLFRGKLEALAQIQLVETLSDDNCLHPALLDACFQAVFAAFPDEVNQAGHSRRDQAVTYLPRSIFGIQTWQNTGRSIWCHASLLVPPHSEKAEIEARLALYSEQGSLIGRVDRLIGVKSKTEALRHLLEPPPFLYEECWVPEVKNDQVPVIHEHEDSGRWLLFRDMLGIGAELARHFASEHRPHFLADARTQLPDSEDGESWNQLIRSLHPLNGIVFTDDLIHGGLEAENSLKRLSAFVRALLRAKLVWPPMLCFATLGACPVGAKASPDPGQAAIWSFAKSLALEHPEFGVRIVDLDPSENPKLAISQILDLIARSANSQIAWRNSTAYTAQLQAVSHADLGIGGTAKKETAPEKASFVQLISKEPGRLETLALVPVKHQPPKAGEIEIQVRAAGLNFRDVLRALGMLEVKQVLGRAVQADLPFGIECAGEVTAVGKGVPFQLGQKVVAVFAAGAMGTRVVLPAQFVALLPDRYSYQEAATLPLAALTAYYGLQKLAKLKPGERVLIHAAAGGVGLAAIQIAKNCGAEIIATASQAKWETLKALGIEKIYNSRSLDFAEAITRDLGVQPIQVVFNSLSGEFIAKSLHLCAPGARFIEIGKLGIWTKEAFAAVRPDIRYHAFDLGEVAAQEPDQVARMLDESMRLWSRPEFQALPFQSFFLSQAQDAFRTMAKGMHVGKLLLVPDSNAEVELPSQVREMLQTTSKVEWQEPQSAGSIWLITGGLGALGMAMAAHIARPDREILLVSRREPDARAVAQIQGLNARGHQIRSLSCDISDEQAVVGLFAGFQKGKPLRGVIHAAGVLDDGPIRDLDSQRLGKVLAPKLKGAWLLHEYTRNLQLEAFVLFSSAAAVLGSQGQSGYAAANAFLDALAHNRRAKGLPATAIAWGAWSGAGMAEKTEAKQLLTRGMRPLHPDTALRLFDLALQSQRPWLAILDIDWPTYIRKVHAEQTPSHLRHLMEQLKTPKPSAKSQQAQPKKSWVWSKEANGAERKRLLLKELQALASKVLGHSKETVIPTNRPLMDLGFDSLLAVEFRNYLATMSEAKLPASLLFDYPTLEKIAGYLEDFLVPKVKESLIKPVESEQETQSAAELLAELDGLLGE